MRSSRRVLILTAVSIACGAAIVGVTFVGLQTPADAVRELDRRIIPASLALTDARTYTAKSQLLFLASLTGSPEGRSAVIADAQAEDVRASEAWKRYQRAAYGSPPEERLQRRYERLHRDGQSAGAEVFALGASPSASPEYEAALVREGDINTRIVATLEEIETRFYTSRVSSELGDARDGLAGTRRAVLIAFAVVLVLGLANAIVLLLGALRQERVIARRDEERIEGQRRADLENQLQRGLEMEPTEEDTYGVIGTALTFARPDSATELLLADAPRAHFRQVLTTDGLGRGPGCPVASPLECPAASSGQTRLFLSGTRLDACPYLRDRDDPDISAACFPVSIAGTTTGVVHTTGPSGQLPPASAMADLELIARKAGDRIGFLRVLERTTSYARIDALTGLVNRRTIDHEADQLVRKGDDFVVAYADLDHFKNLNDDYGHEAGDRALRAFGRVLRDGVRPTDVPGRYGGEEFVVLLPSCTIAEAEVVADRIRQRLASARELAATPGLTVSIGLAEWAPPETFECTLARADAALLNAKTSGRDRVLVAQKDGTGVDQLATAAN